MRLCNFYFEKHTFLLHQSVRVYLGDTSVGDSKLLCIRKEKKSKIQEERSNFQDEWNYIPQYFIMSWSNKWEQMTQL
jgi:hypothetical protein